MATFDENNSRDYIDDILILNNKSNEWTDRQMVDSIMVLNPDAIDSTGK